MVTKTVLPNETRELIINAIKESSNKQLIHGLILCDSSERPDRKNLIVGNICYGPECEKVTCPPKSRASMNIVIEPIEVLGL